MGDEAMNKITGAKTSAASGIDPGGIAPGGTVHSDAKSNPQTEESRSFQAGQDDKTAKDDRIDTDGDGRTRDPNDTRPTDKGGRTAPVQR
jgi:hypothetical protein